MQPGHDVLAFLESPGYKHHAHALAAAGFESMAELTLSSLKSLTNCYVVEGHALRILSEPKKRRHLGVIPARNLLPPPPPPRPSNTMSDFAKLRQKNEKARQKEKERPQR